MERSGFTYRHEWQTGFVAQDQTLWTQVAGWDLSMAAGVDRILRTSPELRFHWTNPKVDHAEDSAPMFNSKQKQMMLSWALTPWFFFENES